MLYWEKYLSEKPLMSQYTFKKLGKRWNIFQVNSNTILWKCSWPYWSCLHYLILNEAIFMGSKRKAFSYVTLIWVVFPIIPVFLIKLILEYYIWKSAKFNISNYIISNQKQFFSGIMSIGIIPMVAIVIK